MPILKTQSTTGILTVTISRPDALNALNAETMNSLADLIQEVFQRKEIRGIILVGEGEKAFVAGADIKELAALNEEKALKLAQKGQKLFQSIEESSKPVIAAVNGFALGGGCELAMACHVRIATENAKFGQPEANLGIIPGYGGTQRLTQLIGKSKAMELLLTGDMISAHEAKSLGLVNHVVSSRGELMILAEQIMNKILSKGPVAIANIIKSVNASFEHLQHGYKTEAAGFAACAATEDFNEGTTAFIQKRQPAFKGK